MQKPSLGRIVHAVVDPRINNDDDVAMAFITRVRNVDGEDRVNLRVLLDTGADIRLTNVKVFDSRPDSDETEGQRVAFWPPRH